MASENQTPARPPLSVSPTFKLKRFAWLTPDRLAVSGTFGGLRETPAEGSPVLVIRAGESVHRLSAVADSLDGPPEEGQVWQAAFVWQDAPVAFDVAELQVGDDLVVELPEPGAKKELSRPRVLEVRTPPKHDIPDGGAASVGSQVELLAAEEELRDVRVAMEQAQAELARARDDLRAERERRAGDSERFRAGLAKVRASAEQALADEQSATRKLDAELREAQEAIETKDAALETLRSQLEAADAAQALAGTEAQAETDALRERVAQLESDEKETERLHAELERSHARTDVARNELKKAGDAIDQARNDAERLLGRLTAIRAK